MKRLHFTTQILSYLITNIPKFILVNSWHHCTFRDLILLSMQHLHHHRDGGRRFFSGSGSGGDQHPRFAEGGRHAVTMATDLVAVDAPVLHATRPTPGVGTCIFGAHATHASRRRRNERAVTPDDSKVSLTKNMPWNVRGCDRPTSIFKVVGKIPNCDIYLVYD